jgi:hypothetical protein
MGYSSFVTQALLVSPAAASGLSLTATGHARYRTRDLYRACILQTGAANNPMKF